MFNYLIFKIINGLTVNLFLICPIVFQAFTEQGVKDDFYVEEKSPVFYIIVIDADFCGIEYVIVVPDRVLLFGQQFFFV